MMFTYDKKSATFDRRKLHLSNVGEWNRPFVQKHPTDIQLK